MTYRRILIACTAIDTSAWPVMNRMGQSMRRSLEVMQGTELPGGALEGVGDRGEEVDAHRVVGVGQAVEQRRHRVLLGHDFHQIPQKNLGKRLLQKSRELGLQINLECFAQHGQWLVL